MRLEELVGGWAGLLGTKHPRRPATMLPVGTALNSMMAGSEERLVVCVWDKMCNLSLISPGWKRSAR